MSKKLVRFLFITYCGFIVWMTLLGRPVTTSRFEFRPFWALQELAVGDPEGIKGIIWYLENILLFIPFGFFLSTVFEGGWKKVILCGLVASIAIELTQYITAVGLTELDDVIANTIGATVGYLLWRLMRKVVESHKKKLRE